jgi:integrase
MILVAYRHGLRASEICDLRWEQFDFNAATLHVRRVKNGKPSTHPIRGDELRALRKLPQHGEDRDIFERLYAVRLDRLRTLGECRSPLKPLDHQGLLTDAWSATSGASAARCHSVRMARQTQAGRFTRGSVMALARLVAAVINKLTLTNWGAPQTTNLGVRSSNLFGRAST